MSTPECSVWRSFGAINRGAATIYNGKLFRITIDNHLLALDMKTGKSAVEPDVRRLPRRLHGDRRADRRQRRRHLRHGWRRVHDARVPRRLGSRHREETVAPLHDSRARRAGIGDLAEGQRCVEGKAAASTWRSGSYDPQLDLVYWGTGNAEPYDPRPRDALDSLYTSSVIAIRPKTGEIACYYQYTPNDVYDVDGDRRARAGGYAGRRPDAQGDDPGQQERIPLRARPHQLRVDRRASLHDGELGIEHRSDDRAPGAHRSLQAVSRG